MRSISDNSVAERLPERGLKGQRSEAMSYCIHVRPEVGVLLRTLAPYVVLRLGRALSELADAAGASSDGGVQDLKVDNCVVRFVVDHARRLLDVVHVEQRDPVSSAAAANSSS